jgi:hypothetical protein
LPQFQILTSAGLQGADATASDKTERCGYLHLDLCIATRCMTGGKTVLHQVDRDIAERTPDRQEDYQ